MIPIIVCVISWGVWGFIEKLALKHTNALMVQLGITCVYALAAPVLYYTAKCSDQLIFDISSIVFAASAGLLTLVGGLAYLCAIKTTGNLGTVTAITATYPIITFVLSWFYMDEQLTLTKTFGVLAIVVGVVTLSM